jgi:uncharacterized protein
MRRALVIVGKAPTPGYTKTRLIPLYSPDETAALYRGFLLDSVDTGLGLQWERVTVVHPRGSGQALAEMLPSSVHLLEQRGNGLGEALPYAFASHFAAGFDRVVLVGSDNPTLPTELIEDAADALVEDDVSIGPCADGGYYLIGLRHPHLGLFEAIDWSTSRVYHQTLARARRLRLRVHVVQEWYDVDEPADLEHLQRELRGLPEHVAPNTRAALEHLAPSVAQV